MEGRDDNCEDAAAKVAHQGGELEAERFAAAGGQDRQQGFVSHAGLNNLLLQTAATAACRCEAKTLEAEEPAQLLHRIMGASAVLAVLRAAGGLTQFPKKLTREWVLQPHPRRKHRIRAGHPQPGQRVSQRKPLGLGLD